MNAKSIYDALGTRYDRFAAVLDRMTPLNKLRAQVLQEAYGDVLEVAVGTGNQLALYPKGVRVVGVDFSERMLDAAVVRAKDLGLHFTPCVADAEKLPQAAASVDCVVCCLAACTFERPERVFGEMRRVLKPGGKALLLEHVQAKGPIGRTLLNGITPLTVRALGCHPNRHTLDTLTSAGFTLGRVDRAVGGILVGVVAS